MNGLRTKIVAGLAALCVLGVLAWAAVEALRDPLSEIKVVDPAPPRAAESAVAPDKSPQGHTALQDPGYVGSETCSDCHADISQAYRSHPMSRSVSPAASTPLRRSSEKPPQFTARGPSDSTLHFEYRVTIDDGEMLHHEIAFDEAANEICRRTVKMHYAVGSGARAHSYFHDAGGELYMSPMTWYAGNRSWDFSPGYEAANQHFERRVLDGCVFCHVGRAAPRPDREHSFQSVPILEMGIGCERCHGPGAAHVAFHQSEHEPHSGADPIVNPRHLNQPFCDDVCLQCHLQGLDRVAHPGRSQFTFRPGQALADVWTILIAGTKVSGDGTTSAVGQAEQMLSSRCYIESRGSMSCTSCHDPHTVPEEAERIRFYRAKCLECHTSGDRIDCAMELSVRLQASREDSCMQCHMPRLEANDVPHTSQTDHRVLRRLGEGADDSGTLEFRVYEQDRIPVELIDRSRGVLLVHQAEEYGPLAQQAIPLLSPWVAANSDDTEALAALGTAYFLAQDTRSAIAMLDLALAIDPNDEYALRQRMFFSHEVGDLEGGLRFGRRLIEVNPHHYDYHGRMAHILGRAGRWDEAIDSALKAAEIRPWSPQIHGWLAEAYRITGQQGLSGKHQTLYEMLQAEDRSTKAP